MELLIAGGIFLLFGILVRRRWNRQKFERHNSLGDDLGDYIEEGEWEHGE